LEAPACNKAASDGDLPDGKGEMAVSRLLDSIPLDVRNHLFARILEGQAADLNEIREILDFLGIEFNYPCFIVILLHIDPADKGTKERNRSKMFSCVIKDILDEEAEAGRDFCPVFADTDNKTGVVINTTKYCTEGSTAWSRSIAEKTLFRLKNRLTDPIHIGVGKIHGGLHGIHRSWQEAAYGIDYRLTERDSLVIYGELQFEGESHCRTDMGKKLKNCIMAGREGEACSFLKNFFEENFKYRKLPFETSRYLFFVIQSDAFRLLTEIRQDLPDICFPDSCEGSEVMKCKTINGLYEAVHCLILRLCVCINNNKKSHNTALLEKIYDYLNKNYTDSNMCIREISQYAGVTPNYLSQFFKQQTGESIMFYMNKMRINKAKELLKYSQSNLKTIAKISGYTNDAILIRTFKKLEGITPGQYRNNCRFME
jgi:AraC-like DNA-binding protein